MLVYQIVLLQDTIVLWLKKLKTSFITVSINGFNLHRELGSQIGPFGWTDAIPLLAGGVIVPKLQSSTYRDKNSLRFTKIFFAAKFLSLFDGLGLLDLSNICKTSNNMDNLDGRGVNKA